MNTNTVLRTLLVALGITLAPMHAMAAGQSALADCYDKILGMCDDPEELDPYEKCVGDGFGLCDNQHPKPMMIDPKRFSIVGLDKNEEQAVRKLLAQRYQRDVELFNAGNDDDDRGTSAGARPAR